MLRVIKAEDKGGGVLEKVEELKARACAEYPRLDPYHAFIAFLNARASDIQFQNEDGERCVWRSVKFDYYHYKDYRGLGWIPVCDNNHRLFFLRQHKMSMSYIDRALGKSISLLVAHPSEKGWNLPKTHKRHFMKFPKEIRDLILKWALVPGSDDIQPMMVTSNWKKNWCSQSLVIDSFPDAEGRISGARDHVVPSIMITRRHNEKEGEYMEYRCVNRAAIDATCLRACKSFFDIGMKMLYSRNTFAFNMCNGYIHSSPPTLLDNGHILRPDPAKPFPLSDLQERQLVDIGMSEIKNQIELTSLSGWVYYDPFLRFLHTIGPKKFPLIKNLRFSGCVKIHDCQWDVCRKKCDDDLVMSLQLYIPIIQSLLPNLEKVILYATKDTYPAPPDEDDEEDVEEDNGDENKKEPPTCESRLLALLENEIRTLSTVKSLEVFDSRRSKISLAEPTIRWFKERAARRAHKKLVADLAEQLAGAKIASLV